MRWMNLAAVVVFCAGLWVFTLHACDTMHAETPINCGSVTPESSALGWCACQMASPICDGSAARGCISEHGDVWPFYDGCKWHCLKLDNNRLLEAGSPLSPGVIHSIVKSNAPDCPHLWPGTQPMWSGSDWTCQSPAFYQTPE